MMCVDNEKRNYKKVTSGQGDSGVCVCIQLYYFAHWLYTLKIVNGALLLAFTVVNTTANHSPFKLGSISLHSSTLSICDTFTPSILGLLNLKLSTHKKYFSVSSIFNCYYSRESSPSHDTVPMEGTSYKFGVFLY